jgi:hypothetical protein
MWWHWEKKKIMSAYEPSAISRGFTKIMTHLPLLYLSEQWAIIRTIMSLTGCCCVSTVDDLDLRGVIPTFSPLIIDSTTAKQKRTHDILVSTEYVLLRYLVWA